MRGGPAPPRPPSHRTPSSMRLNRRLGWMAQRWKRRDGGRSHPSPRRAGPDRCRRALPRIRTQWRVPRRAQSASWRPSGGDFAAWPQCTRGWWRSGYVPRRLSPRPPDARAGARIAQHGVAPTEAMALARAGQVAAWWAHTRNRDSVHAHHAALAGAQWATGAAAERLQRVAAGPQLRSTCLFHRNRERARAEAEAVAARARGRLLRRKRRAQGARRRSQRLRGEGAAASPVEGEGHDTEEEGEEGCEGEAPWTKQARIRGEGLGAVTAAELAFQRERERRRLHFDSWTAPTSQRLGSATLV